MEGIIKANRAPVIPHQLAAAIEILPQCGGGHNNLWLSFVWGLVLFRAITYWEVLIVPTIISYMGIYIIPWV